MPSFSSWHLSEENRPDTGRRCFKKSGVHLQRQMLAAARSPSTSGRFMYTVVILYCEELGRQGGQICLSPRLQKNIFLRQLYNAPILQTTVFCSESQTKTEDKAGLISPMKQQAPTAGNMRLHYMNSWSVYCSGPPALYCINLHLCCLSLSCWLFLLCLNVHEQYTVGTGKVLDMWNVWLAGSPWNFFFDIGQIHMMGPLLFETWRTVSDGSPLGERGANVPNTFQGSTCRASPINSPPLWSKGCLLEGSGYMPSESKRSAVPSQPSLYSQRFCLRRETTTKRWTVSEDGPDTAPVRAS